MIATVPGYDWHKMQSSAHRIAMEQGAAACCYICADAICFFFSLRVQVQLIGTCTMPAVASVPLQSTCRLLVSINSRIVRPAGKACVTKQLENPTHELQVCFSDCVG